jgi:hypothetical protein
MKRATAAAALLLALVAGCGSSNEEGHKLVVGTVDDVVKQGDPALARRLVGISASAGFKAIAVSSIWSPGATAPTAGEVAALRNVVAAARDRKLRVFLVVWNGLAGSTPDRPDERAQFAAYAVALARELPTVRDVIVGNEPNLNTFWLPQFGPGGSDVAAPAYLALLAQTYDALKKVSPEINVIGGTISPRGSDRPGTRRDTHSPTKFIRDLGAAYRASGRTRPVMDSFAFHPYMASSTISPEEKHDRATTITLADYPKLVDLLGDAFDGTPQPGRKLPIYYTEFGVQTQIPDNKLAEYKSLRSPSALDSVDEQTQADYYEQAFELAACQPTVKALFVFHTFDEADLGGWQSGLYYADGTPKDSLEPFRKTAKAAREGTLDADCK